MLVPNTMGLSSRASEGCVAENVAEVQQAIGYARTHKLRFRPLGAGSNIVPRAQINDFVCLIRIGGHVVVHSSASAVSVRVGAGVVWHDFVMTALTEGWFGIENLALIPGLVGAAPVQNIGAYGVEVAQFIESVDVLDERGELFSLRAEECGFGYRCSVFQERPRWTIVGVTFRLLRQPRTVWSYPALEAVLAPHLEDDAPTPEQVAEAVIGIRQAKLPDPQHHPNAGSFFKNPIVPLEQGRALVAEHPALQFFVERGRAKLSAAQLIDLSGWKSRPGEGVECWPLQPLVLVNRGGATATSILRYAEDIRYDVNARFRVQLELEPSVLG